MDGSIPHLDGVEHRFATVGNVTFHYATAGHGEPVVLLHGWPQHWYMWHHQIPEFARRYRVICPDLKGFGWSDAPCDGYEKEQLVDDVIGLLDGLGIKRFRLVAHDWGGWVGFLMCLRYPDRVVCYVALNAPHPFQRIDTRLLALWRFWYQWLIAFPWIGYWLIRASTLVRLILRLGVARKAWSMDELSAYTSRLQEPSRAMASVRLYRTFLLREFLPVVFGRYRSKRLTTKTLLLFGAKDFFLSTQLLRGHERYSSDMTVALVSDCGHFIAEEQQHLVTERALQFLQGGA